MLFTLSVGLLAVFVTVNLTVISAPVTKANPAQDRSFYHLNSTDQALELAVLQLYNGRVRIRKLADDPHK